VGWKASLCFRADLPDKAIETYQGAIALDNGYYKPHEQLGSFYYYRGNYPQAAEEFQQAIDRAPGRFIAYSNLGAALMDMGQFEKAEQALTTSLKLRETAPALNNMGAVLAYQGRDAEAVARYRRAVALDQNNYVHITNLGDSYRRLGLSGPAKKAYRDAMTAALSELGENPKLGHTRSYVALCAARLGDSVRAKSEIGQALMSSPGDNKVFENAVLTYEALHERAEALAILHGATSEFLHQLCRSPDLADFCQDPRFPVVVTQIEERRE